MAAAISYHLMFSLFPLAIVGVGVLGLLTGTRPAREAVIDTIVQVVPFNAEGRQQLSGILVSISGSAAAFGLLGLLGVLWSATGVMAAVRTSMNIAWDVGQGRSFLRGKLVDLLLLLGCGLLLAAGLGVTVLTGFAQTHAHDLPDLLAPLAGPLVAVLAALLTMSLTTATFLTLMRFVPAKRTRFRGDLAGSGHRRRGVRSAAVRIFLLPVPLQPLQPGVRIAGNGRGVHVFRLPGRSDLPLRRRNRLRIPKL